MNYQTSFARDAWNPADFLPVKSPRWPETSTWKQLDDCIVNEFPADLDLTNMRTADGRDRAGEAYVSMLLRQPLCGAAEISTRCAFEERMAPLLVFSPILEGEFREHLELVLYDRGLNLWYHYLDAAGHPAWTLVAYFNLDLLPGVVYELTGRFIFNRRGVFLEMECEGQRFGCRLPEWPETYYAGITACEGHNRFYDFKARSGNFITGGTAERFS